MRIIRGKYKTRYYPIPKSFPSRPTTDFAKEGLFNILEHQYSFEKMNILDLCSGSGSISIEFVSREWGNVTAVDKNYNCVKHLRDMCRKFGCANELKPIKSDILKYLDKCTEKFDLIFADPPYNFGDYERISELVFSRDLLNERGVLIIEHGKQTSLEYITHFKFVRIYGNVCFSFFEKDEL